MNVIELKNILEKFSDTDTVSIELDGKYYPANNVRKEVPEPISMWDEPTILAVITLGGEYDNR